MGKLSFIQLRIKMHKIKMIMETSMSKKIAILLI